MLGIGGLFLSVPIKEIRVFFDSDALLTESFGSFEGPLLTREYDLLYRRLYR